MRALRRLRLRLIASVARTRDEQRLREEVEEHLALQTADNVRAGMSPVEARRQAVLKFGAVEAIKEQYRDDRGLPFLERFLHDVRYGLRQLRRAPVFAVTATLSLAVGIGCNAAIFTIVDRVLLRPLRVSDPHQLVFVTNERARFSYPAYAFLSDNDALRGVAAHFALALNATTHDGATRVRGELVSGTYFRVLGAATQLGRPLTPDDDRTPGSRAVAVISHRFWQRSFGSDPAVLGRDVRLNNYTFTIIGVAARGFTGTEVGLPTDIWLPLMMQKEIGRDLLTETRTNWLEIIGRLKPGQSPERAGAELAAYVDRRAEAAPARFSRRLVLLPADKGNSTLRGQLGPALRVLFVLTGLALVLACVNVASLLVVRTVAREKEIAVRLALGARRSSLVRQFLAETMILAALGGTAGLLVAPWAAGLLVGLQPGLLDIDPSLDIRVFLFGLGAWLLTGLLVGLAPILASRRVRVQVPGSASTSLRTYPRLTVHHVIVTCQIAVSLVILIGAALFVQSMRNLSSVDAGFRPDNLLLIAVDPGSAGYEALRVERFWRDSLDRVSQVPGVLSVSLARTVPLAPGRQRQPVFNPASSEVTEIDTNFVGPRYFHTLGTSLVRGRDFAERDDKTSRSVVIVNERLSRIFWPEQDPIGKVVRLGGPNSATAEVVGIARDVKYRDLRDAAGPMLYLPILQTRSTGAMTLHVRTATEPGDLSSTIRRALQSVDTTLPLFEVRTLEDQLNAFLAQPRQAAVLATGFAILALLLSGIGVYGVTALTVSRQTREIGIRMALGAQPRHIVREIGRRGLTLVMTGLGLGAVGAVGFTRIAGALLYGATANDAATLGMSALLAVVSLTAIYVPARAATRLDSVRAIRYQ
jgi:predicted permease